METIMSIVNLRPR